MPPIVARVLKPATDDVNELYEILFSQITRRSALKQCCSVLQENAALGRPISLFSGYSQRENRTTNYCLLLLKMLYEENPKFLGEVMQSLVGEDLGNLVGVSFRQQERKNSSVPDGLIVQQAFTIYIESKNWDWFSDEQLESHLAALHKENPGLKVLIALSNFESTENSRFMRIREICSEYYKESIIFSEISFEGFVEVLNISHLPKNLSDAIAEFRAYLDEQELLPSWKRWLDVINCAGIPADVIEGNAYMCPATNGAYNHDRCKYFGMYRNKTVDLVALIEAVVDVESDGNSAIKWQNLPQSKKDQQQLAQEKVKQLRPGQYPTRVFILGPLYATKFSKDTPGPMQGSKQYFDIGPLKIDDAQGLAAALNGRTWSEIKRLIAD